MPTLTITRLGANDLPHDWSHVLKIITDLETFFNTTLIDYANAQTNGLRPSNVRSALGMLSIAQKVRNATGSTLTAPTVAGIGGQYNAGSGVTYPSVVKAQAAAVGSAVYAQGILSASIADGNDGSLLTRYELSSLDTSARSVHDPVWLSTTVGGYSYTPPTGIEICQLIGFVSVVHASNGVITFNFPGMLVPYAFADQVGPTS